MKKKKSRFLLFIFSLIPGAGEMYLGFMKIGVSLMSAFALMIMIASYVGMGILAFAAIVIWFYGFFHANNLGALNDEEFARMEDTYLFCKEPWCREIWQGKYRKGLAILLMLLGISMLWHAVCDLLCDILGRDFYNAYIYRFTRIISNEAPAIIISVVTIWFGIKLIQGKKTELDSLDKETEAGEPLKTAEEKNEKEERKAAEAKEGTETAKQAYGQECGIDD